MQPARPVRQDTLDLRDQHYTDDYVRIQSHAEASNYNSTDDEEHSLIEDDSDGEDHDVDYMEDDDDGSSSLSIPNESIDFDLVYSLHSFAATVEGQANVVKGDSLFLMDDSNSYWWLVRVLKTQEVGYIPAENIETPFERLARLNKHRNIDLASATQAELQEDVHASRERLRNNISSRNGSNNTPSPGPRANGTSKGVAFTPALSVHRYPPAVWNEDEEEDEGVEWDDGAYEDEDMDLAQEQQNREDGVVGMEPDDGMSWDDSVAQEMQARQAGRQPQQIQIGGFAASDNQDQQLQLQQQQHQIQVQRQQEYQQQQLLAQQQQQQQAAAAAAAQQAPQQTLRGQGSRDRLNPAQDAVSSVTQAGANRIDPLASTGTRRVTVTPTIARDRNSGEEQDTKGPLLPSVVLQRQDEERKRTREEIEALEESERKRANKGKVAAAPVSSNTLTKANPNTTGKLRKEQPEEDPNKDKEKKKKSGGMFSNLFGRRKDKSKEKDKQGSSSASIDSGSLNEGSRDSDDSLRSGSRPSVTTPEISPTTATAIQQQQHIRNTSDPKRAALQQPQQQPTSSPPQVSQLRQRDQQQQALYLQYLNRSPSSPPEAQANYGLQTAAAVTGSSSFNTSASSASGLGLGPPTPRQRPGSLILTPSSLDGQGVGVPELSVIRVFAGKNLQTEATFKTVLLNSLTTSSDLVKQAIQRFRLPAAEDEKDYYLTIKEVEGSSAVLLPIEHPLKVFEMLVEAAVLPKVKRSSVGSISSVASNLSMHPAIKKLPMNDFTDDSAVKFYLNRRGDDGVDDSASGHDGDDTIVADLSQTAESERSVHLNVLPPSAAVASERFNSPSFRFALQLVIYPDDLPDDMVFDPMTEAIVFKNTLRDRSTHSMSSGVSQNMRRKVFMFPKNVTVAEVIEIGLERFGILEGVVDGGDEVEDKLTKRRSIARVRYGLAIDTGSQEQRELAPSSKVIDAFPTPPTYRAVDRATMDRKRRSVDSTQLLGSLDDVSPDDPIFVLRRAVSYRSSTSRHRMSAPLDEIALQHLHRESASSVGMDTPAAAEESKQQTRQQSRQEIIAAQRAATRANQRAILSAQTNSVRGVDVVLAGNVVLRSSRYEVDERTRYSYVQPDGETYDISDIVEEEWRESGADRNDLLEGVMAQNREAIGDKIDRVLNKIKSGKAGPQGAAVLDGVRATSPLTDLSESETTINGEASGSRAPTPGAGGRATTPTAAQGYASGMASQQPRSQSPSVRARPVTPPTRAVYSATSKRQPSIASVMSDLSTYATPQGVPTPSGSPVGATGPTPAPAPLRKKVPILPKEDFGISHMMAIIECRGSVRKTAAAAEPRMHPVDEMLYGRPCELESLHPDVRSVYLDSFKRLEEMDRLLDEFVQTTIGGF